MYQYNHNGKRWYYENGKWYTSVTNFVKNSLPTPIHLLKWYKDNSAEFIDNTLKETSEYGTLMHAYIEELLQHGSLDVSDIQDETMLRHLTGIAQFFYDYEVEPISIENRLKHDATNSYPLNFAGTVDLIANTNKGVAIIDFKSGNIFDNHKYQMMCYALAYAKPVDHYINVRPKEWRTKPTYEAKHWKVDEQDWKKLQAMCILYEEEPPKARLEVSQIVLNEQPTYNLIEPEQWINQQTSEVDFVI